MAKEQILAKARELGFEAVGITGPGAVAAAQGLRGYLKAGCHGDMAWMEGNVDRRGDPSVLWPGVGGIVMVAMNYGPPDNPMSFLDRPKTGHISVYARGRDYHHVVKKRLKQLGRWVAETFSAEVKVFVDTAPVMEKPLAAAAGLGWQGKHTNLVSRSLGSWSFLGCLFTSLPLAPDVAARESCGSCRACLEACPTNALPAPYRIDARRCISYLTIEHKGQIPEEFRKAMGNRIYGCDDCLAACPWNKFATLAREQAFHPRRDLTAPLLAELAALDDPAFRKLFSGSPVKRLGRDRFIRNVAIALGNAGDPAMAGVLKPLVGDASPLVREAAAWSLDLLGGRPAAP